MSEAQQWVHGQQTKVAQLDATFWQEDFNASVGTHLVAGTYTANAWGLVLATVMPQWGYHLCQVARDQGGRGSLIHMPANQVHHIVHAGLCLS